MYAAFGLCYGIYLFEFSEAQSGKPFIFTCVNLLLSPVGNLVQCFGGPKAEMVWGEFHPSSAGILVGGFGIPYVTLKPLMIWPAI